MAAARPVREPREFHLHRVSKPEEFRAVEEVQREAWGLSGEPPVPASLQRAIQDNGGLVLGAFVDIYLAGFTVSFLGFDGATLYHHSHLTGVRPEYQNHHVGLRLKLLQREEVQRQGLAQVRWMLDPLQSRNAYLALRRLGGVPDRYFPHYYGQVDSDADRGIESDRVRVVWQLDSPRTVARVAGTFPSATDDEARYARSPPLVETTVGDSGIRVPSAVNEPSAPEVHLEIPFDLGLVREHEPTKLRTWRHAVRDAFRSALDAGYRVDDFAVVRAAHERRSVYFLTAPPPAPPPAGPAPP